MLKNFKLENFLMRLFTAWCFTAFVFLFFTDAEISSPELAQSISLLSFAAVFIISFLVFYIIGELFSSHKADFFILIGAVYLYAAKLLTMNRDVYFYIAVMAAVAIALCYALSNLDLNAENDISTGSAITVMAVLAASFTLFTGGLTCLRYLTFSTPNFDFGIFVNMFHNMKETLLPNVTCERDGFLSHFAVHISPIYYLILPFYALFPSPLTLQIAQAVILASGVIPLFMLCRHFSLSNRASVIICAVFCFYPSLSGGCFYDIHENAFLVPLLLWLFLCFEKNNTPWMYICAVLVMLVKEDAPVYVAFFALYILLSRKKYIHGIIMFASSVVYFGGACWLLERFGQGVMTYRYSNYTGSSSAGLIEVIKNVFRNPGSVFTYIFNVDKLPFIICMLAPLLLLPFLSKKPSRLILALPLILINLMPTYQYQYNIYFQYTFGSLAFLFYSSVMTVSETTPQARKKILPAMLAASSLLFLTTTASKTYYVNSYTANLEENTVIAEILDAIPEDVSVRSSTFYLPRIADRNVIYPLQTENYAEYTVIDLRYSSENSRQTYALLSEDADQELVAYEEGLIAVFRDISAD